MYIKYFNYLILIKKIFLTFDDGLKCHYEVAKFLNNQKLNAIFFIPSLDLKIKEYWMFINPHYFSNSKRNGS